MKNSEKKDAFSKFDEAKVEKLETVYGGVMITSPTIVKNIDEAMDFTWTLYDLGIF